MGPRAQLVTHDGNWASRGRMNDRASETGPLSAMICRTSSRKAVAESNAFTMTARIHRGEDGADVVLDSRVADETGGGDLLIGHSGRGQVHDPIPTSRRFSSECEGPRSLRPRGECPTLACGSEEGSVNFPEALLRPTDLTCRVIDEYNGRGRARHAVLCVRLQTIEAGARTAELSSVIPTGCPRSPPRSRSRSSGRSGSSSPEASPW